MADNNNNIPVEEKEADSKQDDPDDTANVDGGAEENPVDEEEDEDDEEYIKFRTDMDDMLKELNDKGDYLTDFNVEFEKLIKSMASSHDNEVRVDRKCRKLTSEISKVKEEIKANEDEIGDIGRRKLKLTDDIEKTWNGVKDTHARLTRKQKDLNETKISVEKLRAKVTLGSGWTNDQRKQFTLLQREEQELENAFDNEQQKLKNAEQRVSETMNELQQADQHRADTEMDIKKIQAQILILEQDTNDADMELKLINARMTNIRDDITRHGAISMEKKQSIEDGEKQIIELESNLKMAKIQMETYLEQYDKLYKESQNMTRVLDQQVHKNAAIEKESETVGHELQLKEHELTGAKKELKGLKKLINKANSRLSGIEMSQDKADKMRMNANDALQQVTADKIAEHKMVDNLKKERDNLERERDILDRDGVTAMERIAKVELMVKINANTKKNLENEISGFIAQARQQREIIDRLQEDVLKYTKEGKIANAAYYAALEEVKYNEVKISELQRKTVESETKLKQLQNLYEQVRSERNLHSKNLIEAQDEISEMKRKFKMMNHDINQMKEEITQKDHSLVKEHFDHHKVEKQKVKIRTDLSKVRKQIESSDQIISNQKDEVQKLGRIIQEAEEERQRQRKELASVVGERDILTTQLVRRGEELANVYEKIKIQRASLKQGERSFEKTMRKQDTLKNELRKLMENLLSLQTDSSDVPERKLEIIRLEQDLLNERAKCQALRDEMKKPINVHRWRKLQDSDPEHYEKLQKLQLLQKEIIKKTEEVVEKDLFIQEKERLYVELKNILARQPGPEVAEQLQVYSKNLKEKKNQMKAMKEELEMYKSQVDEYKYSLEKIDDKFSDLQDEFFEVMDNRRMVNNDMVDDDVNGVNYDVGDNGFIMEDDDDDKNNAGNKFDDGNMKVDDV